ncbi:MAG TPA: class I SAM-dependent methyltransferase [Burkholderiales bacterium]|nr:class I SAM-dependent methyltransferase [Burkholderiales bacterium]
MPYVSTPQSVVEAMLQLAQVRAGDVVYDLGCGDGRIVITAARDFGATGVGIDIDPRRIEEADAMARFAGVSDRVRFAVQDLFKTDFSEATVLALYLVPELNAKLLPKFRAELKPGTRVVSHQYRIGDWAPVRSETAWSGSTDHQIYLWVVPPL